MVRNKEKTESIMQNSKYLLYMDNGAVENFSGRLKVEMFYGEKFERVTLSLMN